MPEEKPEVPVDNLMDDPTADELTAASEATDSVADLQAKLADSEKQATDQLLRLQAEMMNVRRRAERDVENAHKFALERFLTELLPVVDSLERALDTNNENTEEAMREGVSLTLKMFLELLKKFNLEQLDPHGEPFNPQWHEAVSTQENLEVEPGTVIAVLQKGYSLNGRLIRPAMVIVSKATAEV